MNFKHRLNRLENAYGQGCPACANRRGRTILVDAGDAADKTKMPPPCRVCGEVAETVVIITEEVIESAEQLAAADRSNDGPLIIVRST